MQIAPANSVSRFVTVNDLRFHYLDFGGTDVAPADDGRAVILCLHGGAAQAHWFDFVVQPFLNDYRVISLDLRGHGDSDWADSSHYRYLDYAGDVASVISALDAGPVVLVGHSMGGMVALICAATWPDSVSKLVIVDSMMQMSAERAASLRGIGRGDGKSYGSRDEFIQAFKIRPDGSLASEEIRDYMAATSCRQFEDGRWRNKFDRDVYARREAVNGYDYWPRIRVPVLLVAGGESDRISGEVSRKITAVCSRVDIRTVPDSGHHVTLDNPVAFIETLDVYLRETV